MSNRVSKAPNKQRGRKIPDEQWDSYRDRILHLWLEDGDEGRKLDEIVEIMRKQHGFVATASQYHNRLVKKWHIRKNITKNEWRKLYWDEIDRRRAGEDCKVLFNGRLISTETKTREWERYAFASEPRPRDLSPLPETFEYQPYDTTHAPNPSEQLSALVSNHMRINDAGVDSTVVSTIITPASSQVVLGFRPRVFLDMSAIGPFSWGALLDWTKLTKLMGPGNQIVQAWKPDLSRLNAMFYSQHQTPLTVATATNPLLLQHLVSSMINGVTHHETRNQGGVFYLLTTLPRQAVSRFLKALPEETVDIVRQRLRESAVKIDNPDTVQALLELEQGLCVNILRTEAEISAVMDRLKTCGENVAYVIVRYASRMSSRQDLVLSQLLSVLSACKPSARYRLNFVALIKILVEAGAALTQTCFLLNWHDRETLEELMGLEDSDILVWIEAGLLARAVRHGAKINRQDQKLVNWILSSLKKYFHQQLAQDIWTDHDATATCCALVDAFQAGLESSWEWSIEAIYDTGYQLTCFVHYSQTDFNLNSTVMQACSDRNWKRAYQAVSAAKSAGPSQTGFSVEHWKEYQKQLKEAILEEDFDEIEELLNEDDETWEALDMAISHDCDDAAALLATYCGTEGIMNLLEQSKVQAISILLCKHSHWTETIQNLDRASKYDDLEDILYRKEPHKSCRQFPCCLSLPRLETQQIVLRVLSYHALYKSDTAFLDWLQDHGLATESILVVQSEDLVVLELRNLPCQKSKLLNPVSEDEYNRRLPSLIEVATQRNDVTMLSYLLSRRLAHRDSDALLHAVREKSRIATIEMLLRASYPELTKPNRQYGSAALRLAIRYSNYELISILAPATDIHGLEEVVHWEKHLNHLDPLGEAILRKDCIAVDILLKHGGDPNAIVAFDGLGDHAPRSGGNSVLSRMTPLLVAIDIGDFRMVQLLVNKGAQVNRDSTMGVLRTPLQRASEIGDFELVQYFINQKATIDATPVYGGATALQLAAMSGHLGIATLLIEHGADVNYPPARGPGRTAFEAAAEWCRPDMMHLLVQHGALLDLEVEEEVDESSERDGLVESTWNVFFKWRPVRKWRTQYQRALQFTEDRGQYASKRVVEAIGKQLWGDLNDSPWSFVDYDLHTSGLQEVEVPAA